MIINRVGSGTLLTGGSLDVQVSASEDDGWWEDYTNFDNNDTTMALGYQGWHCFALFTGINIPAGSTITAAHIELYLDSGDGASDDTRIYFNDVEEPTAPTTYAQAAAKTLTTAYVTWDIPNTGTWLTSPDISTIIQELINSYGAYSSGEMLLILKSYDAANYQAFRQYDYTGNAYGPKLHIEWE